MKMISAKKTGINFVISNHVNSLVLIAPFYFEIKVMCSVMFYLLLLIEFEFLIDIK